MRSSGNALPFVVLATTPATSSILRWELASIVVGVVLLSFGLAGIAFYFLRRKGGERSLLYFSLFSLLYAIRLIFRQSFFQLLVPLPSGFWGYSELVVDNFIVVPLTLFLIEIVQGHWKRLLRWVLAFQIAFATVRLVLQAFHVGAGPRELVYHLIIVGYCLLLFFYFLPLAFRGERFPHDSKVILAGLAIFGLFVIYSNLVGLRFLPGRDFEPIGFLALVCCMGYVAASRAYSNEQRLLSIQKELEIAQQIQSAILPREVPQIAGLEIAAKYVPMAAVAGDFYDFVVVDDKRVGVFVADVTGHGVPAALIASMLKTALAAQRSTAHDPARVLSGLNQALCGKFEEHFVTAGYLFVDAEKCIMRYAGAGHPPLLLGSRHENGQGAFREVESNGLMLGVHEGATYSAVEFPFHTGQRCVLYTDGVLEARNTAEEEFGGARFRSFLEGQWKLGPGAMILTSLEELARWSGKGAGAVREDDITLVAVDFEGSARGGIAAR